MLENEIGKKVTLAVRDLMRKWSIEPYDEDRGVGFMRHCVVRVGHATGEVLVVLVTNADTFPMSKSFCRELVRRVPQVTSVVQNINIRNTNAILGERSRTLYGPGFILDKLCGLSFRISAGSFYQVNPVQTEALYTKAIELAKVGPSTCVLDAYCGTGTIGLVAAAKGAARVIGVDSVAAAIRDARQNAAHNGIKTAEFVCDDATKFMAGDFEIPDLAAGEFVILMDPPRAGSTPEFLRAAAALVPSRIVYISCNPQTQARDAQELARVGYRLTRLSPVDMFPHTDHIESIALFEPIN
jgi:23S rRNA (uracil1939-C5)-methyltransferase